MSTTCDLETNRLLIPARRSGLLWRGAVSQRASRVELFGMPIENTTVSLESTTWVAAAQQRRKLRAVFVNAHVVNEMTARRSYRTVVASADRILADGSGMALAARLAGRPLVDNVNGTDLFPRLAADAKDAGIKIFLLGGRPGVAEAAHARMMSYGLGGAISGTHHGYFDNGSDREQQVIAAINASGAEVVLVAMGVPRQDEWIATNAKQLNASVLVGVGGLFDFFAGDVQRAPHVMRVVGCEWVWRLAMEPRRMARRYLFGNVNFMVQALRQAIQIRKGSRWVNQARSNWRGTPTG